MTSLTIEQKRVDIYPSAKPGSPVIYLNTFSKTIAPSIRISFMVLPRRLLADFRQKLGFYACTVSAFEQYTLARFLEPVSYTHLTLPTKA